MHRSLCNLKLKQILTPSHLLLDVCHSKQSLTNTNMPRSPQGRTLAVFEILKRYMLLDLEEKNNCMFAVTWVFSESWGFNAFGSF